LKKIFRGLRGLLEALVEFVRLLKTLKKIFRGLLEALVGFCKASEDFEENF